VSADLAEERLMLVNLRSQARRSIAAGALVVSLAPAMWLGAITNDVGLLAATIYAPFALVWGARWLWSGISMHSVASFKLRRLHARDTGLPPARLV
jgi:hypothetical protein